MAAKSEYILLTEYGKLYEARYGRKPVINKYREKWGMRDAIDEIGEANVRECLKYYLSVNPQDGHSLPYFYSNFDKIFDLINRKKEDAVIRRQLREKTRRLVEGE